jgi:Rieske Fe-S protein
MTKWTQTKEKINSNEQKQTNETMEIDQQNMKTNEMKSSEQTNFETSTIDSSNNIYDLYAICNHLGGFMSSGKRNHIQVTNFIIFSISISINTSC